jgi:predicted DNA-binding protein with PD1-like motif
MESRQTDSGYLLRLLPGEELMASLVHFLKRHGRFVMPFGGS